jgi:hypothetical protein
MKNRILLFITVVAAGLLFFFACKSPQPKSDEVQTVPFTAELTGTYKYVGPDTLPEPKCTEPMNVWRALVEGEGTSDPFGKIIVHFDFCGDADGNYGNLEATLITENGDSLFLDGEGQVIEGRLDDHPEHVTSYWRDSFIISGGTGKYEGITGKCTTDDYNSSEDANSHHNWSGSISMKK